jgi:hypothetical protein
MIDYVSNENYEFDPDRPGLCAGFSHIMSEDESNHTWKFHFDDQDTTDYDNKNVPS